MPYLCAWTNTDAHRWKNTTGRSEKKQLTLLIPNSLLATEAPLKSLNLCGYALSFQFRLRREWRREDMPEPGSCPTRLCHCQCVCRFQRQQFHLRNTTVCKDEQSPKTHTHTHRFKPATLLCYWWVVQELATRWEWMGGAVRFHRAFTHNLVALVEARWQGQWIVYMSV